MRKISLIVFKRRLKKIDLSINISIKYNITMYKYFIFILFNVLTLQASMDNLMVKENLISKQLILTGEAKC